MKKNICFAAGGTGGHLFPAQKIAQNLTDCKIIFSGMGLKDSPFLDETHNTYSLQLYGKNRLKLLWSCAAGLINAFRLLKQQKIDAVVGFGSYHCAPILLAALTLRVPIFLVELNVIPGRVNKLFSRFSTTAITFSSTKEKLSGKTLLCSPANFYPNCSAHLKKKEKKILVFGGSLGSSFINEKIPECLPKIPKTPLKITHCTGKQNDPRSVQALYKQKGIEATVVEKTSLEQHWRDADIAIIRAGANSINEMIHYEVPSLVIPFPHAKDKHQHANADFVENVLKGGMYYDETHHEQKNLSTLINTLLYSQYDRFKENIRDYKQKHYHNCMIEEVSTWINQQ